MILCECNSQLTTIISWRVTTRPRERTTAKNVPPLATDHTHHHHQYNTQPKEYTKQHTKGYGKVKVHWSKRNTRTWDRFPVHHHQGGIGSCTDAGAVADKSTVVLARTGDADSYIMDDFI